MAWRRAVKRRRENPLRENYSTAVRGSRKNNKNFEITENYNQIFDWLIKKKIKKLILPYETVGNKIFDNEKFTNKLKQLNIKFFFFLRDWDRNAFPHATKGFFKFKKYIPDLIDLAHI